MRIRIQLFTRLRIRVWNQLLKVMRIHAYPEPCWKEMSSVIQYTPIPSCWRECLSLFSKISKANYPSPLSSPPPRPLSLSPGPLSYPLVAPTQVSMKRGGGGIITFPSIVLDPISRLKQEFLQDRSPGGNPVFLFRQKLDL
jgi:hypothetical protein